LKDTRGLSLSVSVIVPVKNGAATIADLLDSLTQVDYDKNRLEIIVVDGNSTDNTRELVSNYPVRLLMEERPGLNAARNTGINHSRGEVMVFTDCDCVVPRDWVNRIVADASGNRIGCVGGNILRYYDDLLSRYADESIVPAMRRLRRREVLNAAKPPLHYAVGCNMAVTRAAIAEVGMFDEAIRYGFDEIELADRICRGGYGMVLDPEVLVKHKHRSTLRGLLKQMFRYGQGAALLLKMKGARNTFSKWILAFVLGSVAFTSLAFSMAFLTFSIPSPALLAPLLTLLLLAPIGLMIYYVHRSWKSGEKGYRPMVIYPFIDIARAVAFVLGAVYQALKPTKASRARLSVEDGVLPA